MEIFIKKTIAAAMGFAAFAPYDISAESWSTYRDSQSLDLSKLSNKQLLSLRTLLTKHKGVRGVSVLLGDLHKWQQIREDAKAVKPRTLRQFSTILTESLRDTPGHRLFHRRENVHECYYVTRVDYEPEQRTRGDYYPAHVILHMAYEEFGGRHKCNEIFYEEDALGGRSCEEALAEKGYVLETPSLRQNYLAELEKFRRLAKSVGEQQLASGYASDNVDGNNRGRSDSWYWKKPKLIDCTKNDKPTRVVIDVFYEEEEEDRKRNVNLEKYFWPSRTTAEKYDADDTDDTEEAPEIEVPVHPNLAVFHLEKHLRLRIHVSQLQKYKYNPDIAENLVLNSDTRGLIDTLVNGDNEEFMDIVQGKSGGTNVLLCGDPGVGKTLTAEVYAEARSRPLYTIQCSQLGISPEDIEENLLIAFARAKRWRAILQLDEADVYVHRRGDDLQQNAIVGVFLRVLEYQSTILFLTTNRGWDVDDAIASRCIARVVYPRPSVEDQRKIWKILARANAAKLSDSTINSIVGKSGDDTGRDIKNLLKLALLYCGNKEITKKDIDYVRKFRPSLSEKSNSQV